MLLEYKGELQYRFPTKCCLEIVLYLAAKKKARGYYVYSHSRIDPYHAAAMLDLKRGWTGINNVLKINYAF